MMIPVLLTVKIPLTTVGLIAFVIAAAAGLLFLWWWFKRRSAKQVNIKTIVHSTPTQEGELYENSGTLSFIHQNKLSHHTLIGIREITIKESVGPQVYQFHIALIMHHPPHLLLEAQNRGNQVFVNQVLEHLGKNPIDWAAPLPSLHKIGSLTVNGYKFRI